MTIEKPEDEEMESEENNIKREENLKSKVKVIVHAPLFFKSILEQNSIKPQVLIESLDPTSNRDMVFKAGEGAGASGSFFFFSHDREFIIKSMSSSELKCFLKMLPDYELHFKKNPSSMLARVYGVYTIKMHGIATVNLILMANTLMFKSAKNL